MKNTLLALLATTLLLSAASFRFQDGGFAVSRDGKPFLVGDDGVPKGKLELDERTAADGALVRNWWVRDPVRPFRREAVIAQGGKVLEVGFQTYVSAYELPAGTPLSYFVRFDLSRFAGGTWTAVPGPARKVLTNTSGKFSAKGKGPAGQLRALFLESADGKDRLVLDFNVQGPTTYAGAGGAFAGSWHVTCSDGILECGFAPRLPDYGLVLGSRLLAYEGTEETWRTNHPIPSFTYVSAMEPAALLAFGDNTVGKKYRRADGWLGSKPKTVTAAKSGALYSAAKGAGKAACRVKGLTPGIYLVTARFTAYGKPVGPASAAIAGAPLLEKATIPADTVAVASRIVHLDAEADLALDGDWQISTLAVQLLLTDTEDYRFRRGFWKAVGLWEPSPFFPSEHLAAPPDYRTQVALIPLAPHDWKMPSGYRPQWKRETLLPPDSDRNAWRYHTALGTLGPGNSGSFLEFNTPDKIRRRLDELAQTQTRALLINGRLSRHTFPTLAPYVEKTFQTLVPEAHKRGFKIIDHQDFPLLWHAGDGVRVAAPHPGVIQQSVDYATGAWAYCLNNRAYREAYFAEILRQAKERDIDGIMIDEVYFMSAAFCGCADCRARFTADTGLVLPMDETSPDLLDGKSALWNAFRLWRIKTVGDWFVELRRVIQAVKPDFTLMCYTTHYGWATTYASMGKGAALPEVARAIDYLGTEIMSRNVINSFRAIYAFRKMFSSLANRAKTPLFGLVYPQGNYDVAEFGWALNNLANQTTWATTTPPPAGSTHDFAFFRLPYDRRFCRPTARVAILYSLQSNYLPRNFAYNPEPLGYGELLGDLGIQYEYILEESLADLGQYDALLVLNACNLSDDNVKRIRAFAERGGAVLLTGHAATNDELGQERKAWPFADLFNATVLLPYAASKPSNFHGELGDYAKILPAPRFRVLKGGLKARARWQWAGRNGKDSPALIEAPCGKGRVLYLGPQLGAALLQTEQGPSGKYAWKPDPQLLAIAHQFLQREFGALSTVKYHDAPKGLLASLYREERPGQKPRLVLHLLNATGIQLKYGDALTASAPKGTWSPIAKPIVLDLDLAGDFAKATVHAPELPAPQPAALVRRPEGGYRLTIAPGQLPRYAAVIVE